MAKRNPEELRTISVIVTTTQEKELREIQEQRSTEYAKASFASVVREVIQIGLASFPFASDSISETSTDGEVAAA